jgi:type IV secretion system protein VirB10
MGLATVAAITVFGALIWALYQGKGTSTGSGELYNTENKPTPDGLTTLPRDYTGIPRNVPPLGPPLPGDLGRPIRNAQVLVPGPGEIDPEQQRITQEIEAARTSRLFAATSARERPTTPIKPPSSIPTDQGTAPQTGQVEPPPVDPDSILNMQDRKLAFLTAAVDRKTVSPDRLAQHHAMSFRPAPLFQRRLSPAFARICQAKSLLR